MNTTINVKQSEVSPLNVKSIELNNFSPAFQFMYSKGKIEVVYMMGNNIVAKTTQGGVMHKVF